MNKTETASILAIMKTAYPTFYKNNEEIADTITLWAMMFETDSFKTVIEAVKTLMCTLKFPPTIADVKEKINLITQKPIETELEAWGKVANAIKDSNYNASERFTELPIVIQKTIGRAEQLREWACMDTDTVNSVIQSNFMRSYKVKVAMDREYSMLPESTKVMMNGLNVKMLEGIENANSNQ